jgi:hypothetical protein
MFWREVTISNTQRKEIFEADRSLDARFSEKVSNLLTQYL